LLLLAVVIASPGCVTRKLFIHSEPAGAEVFLDGVSVGTTPYSQEFGTYSTHQVELRLPEHDRLVAQAQLARPWWQIFPVSLFTDVFWPGEILDEHDFHWELMPLGDGGTWDQAEQSYERLRELRKRLQDPDDSSGAR